eukprot:2283856-Rhodomonas_salina.1
MEDIASTDLASVDSQRIDTDSIESGFSFGLHPQAVGAGESARGKGERRSAVPAADVACGGRR